MEGCGRGRPRVGGRNDFLWIEHWMHTPLGRPKARQKNARLRTGRMVEKHKRFERTSLLRCGTGLRHNEKARRRGREDSSQQAAFGSMCRARASYDRETLRRFVIHGRPSTSSQALFSAGLAVSCIYLFLSCCFMSSAVTITIQTPSFPPGSLPRFSCSSWAHIVIQAAIDGSEQRMCEDAECHDAGTHLVG